MMMHMMKVIRISFLVGLLLCAHEVYSQQLSLSSQYHQNMLTLNPAYSGFEESTKIVASHRSMLTGLQGAPQSSYVSVEGQGGQGKMGLSFIAFQDRTDIFALTSGMVNYVYKAKLGEESSLNFGLGAGVKNYSIDLDNAKVNNTMDPVLFGNFRQNQIAFNVEAGVVLHAKFLELGAAIPQLLANDPKFVANNGDILNMNAVRHIRGSIKLNFNLNEKKTVVAYPLLVVRYVKGAPIQWDANAVLDIKKYGWIGVTYHSNYAVSVSAGLRHKGFGVGYAHDFSMGRVNDFSKKSSELILSYQFGNKAVDKEWKEKMERDLKTIGNHNIAQEEAIEELEETQEEKEVKINELEEKVKELEGKVEEQNELLKSGAYNTGGNNSGTGNTPTNGTDNSSSATASTTGPMRKAKAIHFTDEAGKQASKGYYVVIGSFASKNNAQKWKKKSEANGDYNTKILYDSQLKMNQVVVFYTDQQDSAMTERLKRSSTQKVWVLNLE